MHMLSALRRYSGLAPDQIQAIALRSLAGVTRPAAEGPLDSPRHVRSPPSGIGSSSREVSSPTSGEFRIPADNGNKHDLPPFVVCAAAREGGIGRSLKSGFRNAET
jgi:hypothetical protein